MTLRNAIDAITTPIVEYHLDRETPHSPIVRLIRQLPTAPPSIRERIHRALLDTSATQLIAGLQVASARLSLWRRAEPISSLYNPSTIRLRRLNGSIVWATGPFLTPTSRR